MAIRVECYAGYRGEQDPLAFWLGERRLAVRDVIDRWFVKILMPIGFMAVTD